MYCMTTLCMALLLFSGTALADEPVSADKAPQKAIEKQADPGTGKSSAATQATNDGPKAPAEATQQNALQGDGASSMDPAQKGGAVKMSGMSILGNEEAPKSLVIVPWKSSQLGDMPGVARLLDSSTQPVDKDVFMRELAYYEIKTKAQ
jgi:hypothetical protein